MTGKQWVLPKEMTKDYEDTFAHYPRGVRQLFYNKKFKTTEEAESFLNPSYDKHVYDPYLFNDMQKAIDLLQQTIEKKEKITIFGDNDADGVCGSVVLGKVFNEIGATFDVYLPHREKEGYGMNEKALDKIAAAGTKVLITVDCGISNIEQIAYANEKGMKVIVTDHHEQLLERPAAHAIIHPLVKGEKYPDKYLCGGGVAFKLSQALIIAYPDKFTNGFDRWLIDLVALSTVADFGKIIGENRSLVRYGMIVINKTKNLGLQALYQKVGLPRNDSPIDVRQLAFQVIPLINAAGRMEHASIAYELLITKDDVKAYDLAEQLVQANVERQRITEQIYKEAKIKLKDKLNNKILVAWDESWLTTVGGIVASRLTHEYNKPTLIIGKRNGQWAGSSRSIPSFHVAEALQRVDKHLEAYGGHAGAAGFTVKGDDPSKLAEAIEKEGEIAFKDVTLTPELLIDAVVSLDDITEDMVDWLEKFKPFGVDNKKPLFLIKDCVTSYSQKLGKNGTHMKVAVARPSGIGSLKFIFFNGTKLYGEKLGEGVCFDAVVELDYNVWRGISEIQVKVMDIVLKEKK